jgi:NAD(P)-dependent dehydrogenase (short-subunit alcohol dehydrogenase family)
LAVGPLADLECLSRPDRDHPNLDVDLLSERRQQVVEQPGFLGRGRRGDGNEGLLRNRRQGCHQEQTTEDVAKAIVFLIGDDFITGHTLICDGGLRFTA